MSDSEVILRLPHASVSESDRQFFGLSADDRLDISWPQQCAVTGDKAEASLPLTAEKKNTLLRFQVPASKETADFRKRNFNWISTAGLWLTYTGIIGFFIVLFFKYSFSTADNSDGGQLLGWTVLCAFIAFSGFYFVRLMRWLWPSYGHWCKLPGVHAKIIDSKPYYVDISFRFLNKEFGRLFKVENHHLLREKIRQKIQEELSETEEALHRGQAEDYFTAGMARERAGDAEKAIEYYEKTLELDSSFSMARKHKGANLLWLNRAALAQESLQEYLQESAADVEALLLLASVHEIKNEYSNAEKLYEQALLLSDDPSIHERAGDVAYHMGNYSSAAEHFMKAVQQAEKSFLLHAKWLQSLEQAGNKDGLKEALKTTETHLPERSEEFRSRYGA